jgi:hypothetical protein
MRLNKYKVRFYGTLSTDARVIQAKNKQEAKEKFAAIEGCPSDSCYIDIVTFSQKFK